MKIKFEIEVKNGSFKLPERHLLPSNYKTLTVSAMVGEEYFFLSSKYETDTNDFTRLIFNVGCIFGSIYTHEKCNLDAVNCILVVGYQL